MAAGPSKAIRASWPSHRSKTASILAESTLSSMTRIRSDVVVMGAIARSGLKRLVIGNTAEAVLDALTCDLLIVKPPGFTTDLQAEARGLRCAVSAMTQVPY